MDGGGPSDVLLISGVSNPSPQQVWTRPTLCPQVTATATTMATQLVSEVTLPVVGSCWLWLGGDPPGPPGDQLRCVSGLGFPADLTDATGGKALKRKGK